MKLLVTGGTGFVGRHVVDAALARGIETVVVGRSRHDDLGCEFVAADLMVAGVPEDVIRRIRPTHLLNLAWEASPGHFWTSTNNVDWAARSITLFRAFYENGGARAVGIGSCAEYAWDVSSLDEEKTPLRPATLYGASKKAVFDLITAFSAQQQLSFAWARPFWIYGPREAAGRLVSDLSSALLQGKEALTGPGEIRRDYLHVADVATALIGVLSTDYRGPVNIASGRAARIDEIALCLAEAFGRPDLLRIGGRPSTVVEVEQVCGANTVLRDAIGFAPRYSLEGGLRDTATWWMDQHGS